MSIFRWPGGDPGPNILRIGMKSRSAQGLPKFRVGLKPFEDDSNIGVSGKRCHGEIGVTGMEVDRLRSYLYDRVSLIVQCL